MVILFDFPLSSNHINSGPLPILPISDPIDRPVEFMPSKSPYDTRHMLAGYTDSSGQWISGFFDKASIYLEFFFSDLDFSPY
jgi:hypothetical protein